MKMEQSVPKRRHIKFRRRGITQKKAKKFTIYTITVYITVLFPCIIYTATCFDILCHHQGVIHLLLAVTRFLRFQSAHEGGKVVSPTHRPPLTTPGNIPGTHFR